MNGRELASMLSESCLQFSCKHSFICSVDFLKSQRRRTQPEQDKTEVLVCQLKAEICNPDNILGISSAKEEIECVCITNVVLRSDVKKK